METDGDLCCLSGSYAVSCGLLQRWCRQWCLVFFQFCRASASAPPSAWFVPVRRSFSYLVPEDPVVELSSVEKAHLLSDVALDDLLPNLRAVLVLKRRRQCQRLPSSVSPADRAGPGCAASEPSLSQDAVCQRTGMPRRTSFFSLASSCLMGMSP